MGRLAPLLPSAFISGAAALAAEVLWTRILRRLLGSTSGSQAAVLAGMLGGMALGGYLGERWIRSRGGGAAAALRGWIGSALAAGALALLFHLLLGLLESLDTLPAASPALLIAGVALAALPLGAGFPLLVRALGPEAGRREVGLIYGVGSLGGAAGALAAPLVLLPLLGERACLLLAAGFQGLAAAAAALLVPRAAADPASRAPSPGEADAGQTRARREEAGSPLGLACALVFLSGLSVVYWEILWTRILVLVVGSSVHAFAVVAAGVLVGVGGASLFLGRLLGGASPAGAGAVLALVVLGVLAVLDPAVPHLEEAYLLGARALGASHWMGALAAGAMVLFATTPLGLVFPGAAGRLPLSSGRLAAASGGGAAAGALLAGAALPGRAGIEVSYLLGMALVALLGLLGAQASPPRTRRRLLCVLGLLSCLPAAGRLALGRWEVANLLSGVYQLREEDLLSGTPAGRREVLVLVEGREAIVSVERVERQEAATLLVKGNGKVEGSVPADPGRPSLADLPTQTLLGVLPALAAPAERTAGLIGLGSGTTLGAAHRAGFASIDLMEIEPAFEKALLAPAAAARFAPYLAGALESPSVRRWSGDARALLAGPLAGRRFGALVSQPSEPWLPQSAPLFTREFFARGAKRLAPRGLFVQWVQLYKLPLPALEVVVRTFRSVFERVFVLRPPGTGELILVAAQGPLDLGALHQGALELQVRAPELLAAAGLAEPLDLLAAFLLGPDGVDRWVRPGEGLPLNTDDRGGLEVLAAGLLHRGEDLALSNLQLLRRRGGEDPVARYLPPSLRSPEVLRRLAARNLRLGDFWEVLATLSGDRSEEAAALEAEARREIAAQDRPDVQAGSGSEDSR